MSEPLVIGILIVVFLIYLFVRRIRNLIVGYGRPPDMERVRRRYAEIHSEHERLKRKRYERKARRAKTPVRKRKLEEKASFWKRAEELAKRRAQEQANPGRNMQRHGIRRSGTERGWWRE